MKKLLPLLAALAVPAQAQDADLYYASDAWPVHRANGACAMERIGQPDSGFGQLAVEYDAARDLVMLSTSAPVESGLPASGAVDFEIVFLDNGDVKHDDTWFSRKFAYTSEDGVYRFTTAFSGERTVRQVLADLANSRRLGFLRDGEVLFDHDLAGARESLNRLRTCATATVASR